MQNPRAHFVVNLGDDRFDVIAGCKLNEAPLSLADANGLRTCTDSTISVIGSLVNEPDDTMTGDAA